VRHFWTVEFEQYPKMFRTETISPIQNEVGQFLTNPLTRNILGQTRTKFDMLNVMDSGKILLLNLVKGKIGEDTYSLLGALMLTQLHLAALRRAHIQETARRDYYLYIDELQSFTTEGFPSILAEARKYRLNIAGMANQFISQLPDHIASAILGNVGTLIAFAAGSEDADILGRELAPSFSTSDLQGLPQFAIYLKLSINGRTSTPFSAETLPPIEKPSKSYRLQVISQSRQRYSSHSLAVSANIRRWLAH
jgi:hypothetical protein